MEQSTQNMEDINKTSVVQGGGAKWNGGNSERSGAICEQGVFLINAFAYLY